MAFYKLFYILHRRTDWFRLWRWEREIMMPEWYEERERQAELAFRKLMMPFRICEMMLGDKADFYLNRM